MLIDHIIRKFNLEMDRTVRGVTPQALEQLEAYPWPGNVRELENQIKRAMVLSREDVLPVHLFEFDTKRIESINLEDEKRLSKAVLSYMEKAVSREKISQDLFGHIIGIVEKTMIHEILQQTSGNQLQASQRLAIHRSTLRKKIKDYDINLTE